MHIDPGEVAEEIRAAFAEVPPAGPFLGSVRGVEVEVDADGDLTDLFVDEEVCGAADLGAAVVAAHRAARESALAARLDAVLDVLARVGPARPEAWPA